MKKQRLFYLDLIRAVALVCILVIHFNAAVTGYFTLPSKLFGSVLPFNIYLGDFGSSLFFMVSGAALQYTSPGQGREPLNLGALLPKARQGGVPHVLAGVVYLLSHPFCHKAGILCRSQNAQPAADGPGAG